MKKLLSIILSITMLFSMTAVSFADGVDGPMQKAKITVGTSADFKPFEYYDENGELAGFDIDLMKYIGEKIGFDVEFVNMSFDKLIPAVVNGEVDCAISAITATDERDFVIDYTVPYLESKSELDGLSQHEKYAIVFPNKSKETAILKEAAGDPYVSTYTLVNDAIDELISDATLEKLIRQYGLNKATAETGYSYFGISVSNGYYPGVGPVIIGGGVVDIPIDEENADYVASGSPLVPPSDWATADVEKAKALNITIDDVIYRYRMSITREEFCNLAYNYIAEFGKDLEVSNNHKFNDTDNVKVEALSSLGIIKGKFETEFAPNDFLTREEAATILERLINVVHPGMGTDTEYITFADSSVISDWAMSSIQTIYKLGIMNGVGNDRFAPKDTYTTEQAIVTLVRVYANSGVSKNDNIDTEDEVEFYNINSNDNTRGEKIEKQEDGWYKLQSVAGSFISYDGEEPKSVTAYFTPAGTDTEQYEKQVGFNEMLKPQNPVSVKLTFEEEDTLGHLHFVFEYENGAKTSSEIYNVLIEH